MRYGLEQDPDDDLSDLHAVTSRMFSESLLNELTASEAIQLERDPQRFLFMMVKRAKQLSAELGSAKSQVEVLMENFDRLKKRLESAERDRDLLIEHQVAAQKIHSIFLDVQGALEGLVDACDRDNYHETRVHMMELSRALSDYLADKVIPENS